MLLIEIIPAAFSATPAFLKGLVIGYKAVKHHFSQIKINKVEAEADGASD